MFKGAYKEESLAILFFCFERFWSLSFAVICIHMEGWRRRIAKHDDLIEFLLPDCDIVAPCR